MPRPPSDPIVIRDRLLPLVPICHGRCQINMRPRADEDLVVHRSRQINTAQAEQCLQLFHRHLAGRRLLEVEHLNRPEIPSIDDYPIAYHRHSLLRLFQ